LYARQLKEKDITACPINGYYPDGSTMEVLTKLGLYDNMDKIDFCWCNSFVINTCHIEQLYGYFKQIVITVRAQSCASEGYLARILWELNGRKSCGDIDGNIQQLKDKHYYCWTVNLLENQTSFCQMCSTKDRNDSRMIEFLLSFKTILYSLDFL